MRAGPRAGLSLFALLAAIVVPAPAAADSKSECIAAAESADDLHRAGKLVEARKLLVSCASERCHPIVRKDCATALESVNKALPTVVLSAHDGAGREVIRGRVFIDDDNVARELDGKALPLDPGRHTFRFEVQGCERASQEALLIEGEKHHVVAGALTCAGATPASAAVPPPLQPAPGDAPGPSYVLPITFAGVGLLGLGAFTYFGLKGRADLDQIRATDCAPFCDRDAVQSAKTKLVVGDVLGAVGLVSLGVAVWMTISMRSAPRKAALGIDVSPSSTGMAASFRSPF